MKSIEKQFPIYRKYVGIETYFKIESNKEFIEIKKVGNLYVKHHIVATQFPETQLIKDMIDVYEGRWEEINKDLFDEVDLKLNY